MASEQQMKNPLFVGKAIRAQLEHEIPRDLPLERDFRERTEFTVTDQVNSLHAELCSNPRTLHIFTSLVTHLHAFARETHLTHTEWRTAVDFLTRAGKESTPSLNEFVMLSDCLGLSALVDELEHPKPPGCTDSCEEGPFYTEDGPVVETGATLAGSKTPGERMFFRATVKDTQGRPIKGARATMWQADGDGVYDIQYDDRKEANDRGTILADNEGTFSYRGILPTAYPMPSDGPNGDMLRALGRHPHRASHIHWRITAPGFDELTTALYPAHSPFLGTDPVFATKKSLICDVTPTANPNEWKEMGFADGEVERHGGRVWVWQFGFVLPSVEEVEILKRELETRV